jgi:hypothetical protein
MDYLLKMRNIISELEQYGYENDAQKIKMLRESASVGSELLMSVTHELLLLINNSELKKLIGKDVMGLKNYCWSIGLMVS